MKINNNLVSIIVPVYNAQKYLDKCIKSLINQIYTNIEIVLVDDGSTDDSNKICEKYAMQDKRIKIVRQNNSGVGNARNKGIMSASGKYIAFCDSDDEAYPNYIIEMIEAINDENRMSFGCYAQKYIDGTMNSRKLDKQGKVDLIKEFEYFYRSGCLQNVYCKLFVLDIIQKNNIRFNENMIFGEDFKFVMDYIEIESKAYFVNEVIYNYNINDNSLITKVNETKVNNYIFLNEYFYKFIKRHNIYEEMKNVYKEHFINDYIGIVLGIMRDEKNSDKKKLFNIIKGSHKINKDEKGLKISTIKKVVLQVDNYYIWYIISRIKKSKGRN